MKQRLFLFVGASLFFISSAMAAEEPARKVTSYSFDRPSQVGFKAKATLHDFRGVGSAVTGRFELDLAHLDKPGRGAIELQAATLNTKNRKRDKVMKEESLKVAQYPLIRFVIQKAKLDFNDPAQKKADYILGGDLEICGKTRKIDHIVATLDYNRQENLKIEGSFPLKISDYGIVIPSFAKIFKVKDEVRVTFNLVAVPNS